VIGDSTVAKSVIWTSAPLVATQRAGLGEGDGEGLGDGDGVGVGVDVEVLVADVTTKFCDAPAHCPDAVRHATVYPKVPLIGGVTVRWPLSGNEPCHAALA